jgi:rubrerythrin
MITKDDAKNYLDQMLRTELEMEKNYLEMEKNIKDLELKNIFETMCREERGHAVYVRELLKLLDKWK